MPVAMNLHTMISNTNENGVLLIGGDDGTTRYKDIYLLECSNSVHDCKWKKLEQEMRYAREGFIAMRIPDHVANQITCTVPSG